MVAIAISVTQAVQGFGDFGLYSGSSRRDLDEHYRLSMRDDGYAVSVVTAVLVLGAICVAAFTSFLEPRGAGVYAAAILAGAVLSARKAESLSAVQFGDEVRAARLNLVWQNAPKVGMLVGGVATGTALGTLAGGLLSAIGFASPMRPRLSGLISRLRLTKRHWAPGLLLVVSAFAAQWIETYVLTIASGLAAVGEYQAILRPMIAATYLYLPLVGMLHVALNLRLASRARRLTLGALTVVAIYVSLAGAALVTLGSAVWPEYRFPVSVVAIVGAATWVSSCSAVLGAHLLVDGAHYRAAVATIAGAIVLLLSSLMMVPDLGITGAALGSLFGWATAAILQGFEVYRRGTRDEVVD